MRYVEATAPVGYYTLKRYQVRAQVDIVTSHFIQSARENTAELHDLHHFESAAERLEFIDSLLADNMYLFPIAERVEGGVRGPNPTQR
jgi:ferritin-like protein